MNLKDIVDGLDKRKPFPAFRVGDTVRVHVRIVEGEKERIQVFEGIVIRRRRGGKGASFTVRKISYGVGVERVFAEQSPSVERVEVLTRGKVRRARLFYLRPKKGKESGVEGTPVVGEPEPAEEVATKTEPRKEAGQKAPTMESSAPAP
jgi:large subunit ribosomal protein L19